MKSRLPLLIGLVFAALPTAQAHRVDEYLQATFIAVEKTQLRVDVFLTPGIEVLPSVVAVIDADGDGTFSAAEQRSYARRVVQDLTFALNGAALAVDLKRFDFPTAAELRDGSGDIHLEIVVQLPDVGAPAAKLSFENRHQSQIAAYQVNCLAPRDLAVRVGEQQRDPLQATLTIAIAIAPPALTFSPTSRRAGF